MQPRLIRLRDAPAYLGMDKNRFNKEVRPYLSEIPIGKQGVAFDRLDLDNWIAQYKVCNERPVVRRKLWDAKEYQVSIREEIPGTLTNKSMGSVFQKALAQLASKKPKNT